jgi:peptide/nickel transport system permease protein
VGRYLRRKAFIYLVTFFVAVTLTWLIPRLMPGDPITSMVARQGGLQQAEQFKAMEDYYNRVFGLDTPLWRQYVNYWIALFQGDLGISVYAFPTPVATLIRGALPYSIGLLLPAILLSWWVGNKLGAAAARRRWLDNTLLPISYLLTATPYVWMAILLSWSLGVVWGVFPTAFGYDQTLVPAFTWRFISSVISHWFLPFLSLFLVLVGGWAIGMRNLVIYELETDYANYLYSLGAPDRLVRRYAFRNSLLPQITGLALQVGVIVAGNIVTEVVFAYPGLGSLILSAITRSDFFLLQGVLLFVVIGVLVANFVIDIAYVYVDPRTRTGLQGGGA